jgi:hypothetical protein
MVDRVTVRPVPVSTRWTVKVLSLSALSVHVTLIPPVTATAATLVGAAGGPTMIAGEVAVLVGMPSTPAP